MTSYFPLIMIFMTVLSFGGGIGLKQYAVSREVLWLVAAFASYAGANVLSVLLIEQTGLARAMVMASASSIVFFTVAGVFYREPLNVYSFAAAGLAICAIVLAFAGDQRAANPSKSTQKIEENVDA